MEPPGSGHRRRISPRLAPAIELAILWPPTYNIT